MRMTIRHIGRRTTITMKAGKGEDLRGVVEALTGYCLSDDPEKRLTVKSNDDLTAIEDCQDIARKIHG